MIIDRCWNQNTIKRSGLFQNYSRFDVKARKRGKPKTREKRRKQATRKEAKQSKRQASHKRPRFHLSSTPKGGKVKKDFLCLKASRESFSPVYLNYQSRLFFADTESWIIITFTCKGLQDVCTAASRLSLSRSTPALVAQKRDKEVECFDADRVGAVFSSEDHLVSVWASYFSYLSMYTVPSMLIPVSDSR